MYRYAVLLTIGMPFLVQGMDLDALAHACDMEQSSRSKFKLELPQQDPEDSLIVSEQQNVLHDQSAFKKDVNSRYNQRRIGLPRYAYFVEGDYYRTGQPFEKPVVFTHEIKVKRKGYNIEQKEKIMDRNISSFDNTRKKRKK